MLITSLHTGTVCLFVKAEIQAFPATNILRVIRMKRTESLRVCSTVEAGSFMYIKFAQSKVRHGTWRLFGNSETNSPEMFYFIFPPLCPKFIFLTCTKTLYNV